MLNQIPRGHWGINVQGWDLSLPLINRMEVILGIFCKVCILETKHHGNQLWITKIKTTFWWAKHTYSLSVLSCIDRFLKLAGQMPSRPHREGRSKVLLLEHHTSHLDSFLLQVHFHIYVPSSWHTGLNIYLLCQFLIATVVSRLG